MLKLLRRLVSANGPAGAGHRPRRPTSATSDILARRTAPAPPSKKPGASDDVNFDPYNTGAFDRASSWQRIGKRDY